jgi:hypothetical protein
MHAFMPIGSTVIVDFMLGASPTRHFAIASSLTAHASVWSPMADIGGLMSTTPAEFYIRLIVAKTEAVLVPANTTEGRRCAFA